MVWPRPAAGTPRGHRADPRQLAGGGQRAEQAQAADLQPQADEDGGAAGRAGRRVQVGDGEVDHLGQPPLGDVRQMAGEAASRA